MKLKKDFTIYLKLALSIENNVSYEKWYNQDCGQLQSQSFFVYLVLSTMIIFWTDILLCYNESSLYSHKIVKKNNIKVCKILKPVLFD